MSNILGIKGRGPSPLASVQPALITARQIADARDLGAIMEAARHTPTERPGTHSSFVPQTFDLSATGAGTEGRQFPLKGTKLVFLREGSAPGAKLDVDLGAGRVRRMSPGDRLVEPFDSIRVLRNAASAAAGNAELLIIEGNDDHNFFEAEARIGQPFPPIDLLGNSAAGTFVAVTEDTQPSGAAPTGAFTATGFRDFLLLIDGQTGGVNATSFDLVPWYREPNGAIWFEQGTELISVPDSIATGYRYRLVQFSARVTGLVYFEIRNLLAAARTGLGFQVQAIG